MIYKAKTVAYDFVMALGASLIIFRPKHIFEHFSVSTHIFHVFYPSQIYLFATFLSQIIPRPGDNFYDAGVYNTTDPLWDTYFKQMYITTTVCEKHNLTEIDDGTEYFYNETNRNTFYDPVVDLNMSSSIYSRSTEMEPRSTVQLLSTVDSSSPIVSSVTSYNYTDMTYTTCNTYHTGLHIDWYYPIYPIYTIYTIYPLYPLYPLYPRYTIHYIHFIHYIHYMHYRYATLGNHDYGSGATGVQAQINRTYQSDDDSWKMEDQYYAKQYELADGSRVVILYIDTTTLAPSENGCCNEEGGISNNTQLERISTQLTWINTTLAEARSTAHPTWIIVAGHYPTFSVGEQGDTSEIVTYLLPLLQKYEVDAYFCGHDHISEHLQYNGTNYYVAGAGSKTDQIGVVNGSTAELLWYI